MIGSLKNMSALLLTFNFCWQFVKLFDAARNFGEQGGEATGRKNVEVSLCKKRNKEKRGEISSFAV